MHGQGYSKVSRLQKVRDRCKNIDKGWVEGPLSQWEVESESTSLFGYPGVTRHWEILGQVIHCHLNCVAPASL